VECLPGDLPERIDVDVSELRANQSIHVRDLALGERVRILSNLDQVVALVKFLRADAETAAEGEGAVAETAEAKDAKEGAKA
jgi:large subunit ribosomal protein L25